MFRILAVLAIAFACATEATHLSARRVALARQEAAPPAHAGYPAAGVTPAVPFELPAMTSERPESNYLPPVNSYGPPAAEALPEVVYGPPDNTYGPPPQLPDEQEAEKDAAQPSAEGPQDAAPPLAQGQDEEEPEEQVQVAVAEDGTVIAVANADDLNESTSVDSAPVRLVYQRFPQGRRPPAPVPERLIALPAANVAYSSRYQRL